MGYYTAYSLEVQDATKEQLDDICTFLKERNVINYALDEYFECCEIVKWYDHDDDMLALSERFPDLLFCLHGEGEDNTDLWNTYYRDGKMQVCRAEIVYPEFDPMKLHPPKKKPW